ncbi:MAG: VWA domain-containing protein [Acidobacteria bacterium]|nr:VWA domain-containing protein [Acidobacteriota bacterium]
MNGTIPILIPAPHRFRFLLPALLLAGLSGQPQPTFSSAARLVEINVTALDAKGAPVPTLTASHLTLTDNGKPRPIAFFRYEGQAALDPPKARLPLNFFSNRIEYSGGPPRNVTVLLLDSLNTEPGDQLMVKAQAMQFLKQLAPRTRVAVYHLGPKFRIIHEFTADTESLRRQLARFQTGQPSQRLSDIDVLATEFEQWLLATGNNPQLASGLEAALSGEQHFNTTARRTRVAQTLGRLEEISRHIQGIPGRKNIVWITGGIAMYSARPPVRGSATERQRMNPFVGEDFEKDINATARRLAQAGIVLYAVDARGLFSGAENFASLQDMPALNGRYAEIQQTAALSADTRSALGALTGATGGRLLFNTNDFTEGIRRAANDQLGAYSLAFYADAEPDGKWHALKLSSSLPGLRLSYRQGYLAGGSAPPAQPQEQLRAALLSPLGASAIRITAHCVPAASAGDLVLTALIDPADIAFTANQDRRSASFEVTIGELSPQGEVRFQQSAVRLNLTAAQSAAIREKGIPFRQTLRPAPTTHALRILVQQCETGLSGTLDIPLKEIRILP